MGVGAKNNGNWSHSTPQTLMSYRISEQSLLACAPVDIHVVWFCAQCNGRWGQFRGCIRPIFRPDSPFAAPKNGFADRGAGGLYRPGSIWTYANSDKKRKKWVNKPSPRYVFSVSFLVVFVRFSKNLHFCFSVRRGIWFKFPFKWWKMDPPKGSKKEVFWSKKSVFPDFDPFWLIFPIVRTWSSAKDHPFSGLFQVFPWFWTKKWKKGQIFNFSWAPP